MRFAQTILVAAVLLSVLALSGPVAYADEPTLLERLSAETTRLAERARRGTAELSMGGLTVQAVVVGAPPRLVTLHQEIGQYAEVRFVLFGGRAGIAKRIAHDPELDVVVYALPEGVVPVGGTLVPEARWALPAGRVAVLAGSKPRLLLMPDAGRGRDGLDVGDRTAKGVLLGADGTLLGFRPRVKYAPDHAGLRETYLRARRAFQTATVIPPERVLLPPYVVPPKAPAPAPVIEMVRPAPVFQTQRAHLIPAVRYSVESRSTLTPGTFLPGALIHRVLSDLEHGRIRHAYVGVVPAPAAKGAGARLVTVLSGSPAAAAGLRAGDEITLINGERIVDVAAFTRQVVLSAPGEILDLRVRGREGLVRVTLEEQAEARSTLTTPVQLGLGLVPLTPELRMWLSLDGPEAGLVVRSVGPNSKAAKAGLKRGDVIVAAGGEPTRDVEEFLAALAGVTEEIVLTVRAGKSEVPVTLRLPDVKGGADSR